MFSDSNNSKKFSNGTLQIDNDITQGHKAVAVKRISKETQRKYKH